MNRKLVLFILLAGVTNVSRSQELKFGHVNSNEIIQAMPEFESARSQFESLRLELTEYLQVLSSDMEKKYNSYLEESKNLSQVVRQVKEQELADMDRRIQEYQSNAQNQLTQMQEELFSPVYSKALQAIRDVGKENKFIYIFDTSQTELLYFDKNKSVDITSLVKSRLGIK